MGTLRPKRDQAKDRVLERKAASSVLALSVLLGFAGCSKSGSRVPHVPPGGAAGRTDRSAGNGDAEPILTKEQVGAILGQPVTSVEGKGTNLQYKTAVMLLETNIELEDRGDIPDAIRSMNGARTATGLLGGQPENVPGLGNEALFGAMSALYLRKGSAFIHIQPPNLQMIAASKAAERVRAAKLGSDEQVRAMEELKKIERTDPLSAGLKSETAARGAVAVIGASSKKQGTSYESDARAMAVALATQLLEKL